MIPSSFNRLSKVIIKHAHFSGSGVIQGKVTNIPDEDAIYCTDRIRREIFNPETITSINGLIVGYEGPFSHRANYLRALASSMGCTLNVVYDVGKYWKEISLEDECHIDFISRKIRTTNKLYTASSISAIRSDIIAFNLKDTKCRCYKPYYKYNNTLARIQSNGIKKGAEKHLGLIVGTLIDSNGLIWFSGYPGPDELANFFITNPNLYHKLMGKYSNILSEFLDFFYNLKSSNYDKTTESKLLQKKLHDNYEFSFICTQPTSKFGNYLYSEDSNKFDLVLEKLENISINLSLIHI